MHKTYWPAGPVDSTEVKDKIDNDKEELLEVT